MKHKDKVLAVTGGAAGIGLATARRWLEEGGRVFLLDLRQPALSAAVASLGDSDRVRGLVCDISDATSVAETFAAIAAAGGLHGLTNCAGIMIPAPSAEVRDEDFHRLLDIHVVGAMRCCRAAFPVLRRSGGAIVNISSVAALTGMPQRAAYCAAKAAIGGLTRTLAVEWAREGVRVNAVAPGYVRTAMTGDLIAIGKIDEGKIAARTPLGRFATPEEMAGPISFLLSQDASYITGHSLFVDGGMTIDGNWY